jgi:hypothetical protein
MGLDKSTLLTSATANGRFSLLLSGHQMSYIGRKAAVTGHNKFVMLAAVRAHQFCFQWLRD